MKMTPGQSAKLQRLIDYRDKIKDLPIIRELPVYEALSYEEKVSRIKAWDAYYQRVKNGKAGKLFFSGRAAIEAKNYDVVKSNGMRASKALAKGWEDDLGRPNFRDPYEYTNDSIVQSWKLINATIAELEGTTEKAPF